jgi:ribosome recycling factor
MINEITKNSDNNMRKCVDNLKHELSKLRTGRAHPSLVEHIEVEYYGNKTTLNHIASVTVSDPRTLSITPWEKAMIKPIEKAIMVSDLGLNPMSDSTSVRIPLPLLTEERRKDLVKVVKSTAEQSRVTIRNIRRDANNALKELLKKKEISEDEEHKAQDNIQKLTDKFVAETDKIASAKEADLMEV